MEPSPDELPDLMAGLEGDREAVLATVRRLLLARLAEDELTPDERLQARLLLRELDASGQQPGDAASL